MSQPKVSLIVPVYDVSSYLKNCLSSLVGQSLADIEIILVNDCSPDPLDQEICRQFAQKDSRIVYVEHEGNTGQGGARNTGIRLSKADYLGFVDSDDYLDHEMYEVMFREATEHDLDVVDCGARKVDEDGNFLSIYLRHDRAAELGGKEAFEAFLGMNSHQVYPTCWNKLWRRSLFSDHHIEFPENLYFEDLATVPRLLFHAERVKLIPETFYQYTQRQASFMKSGSEKHLRDFKTVQQLLQGFLVENDAWKTYGDPYGKKVELQIKSWFFREMIWSKRWENPRLLIQFFRTYWREYLAGKFSSRGFR